MKKLLLLFAVFLTAITASAQFTEVQVGSLYYRIWNNTHIAKVYKPLSGSYTGDIYIPSEITYNNETYTVDAIFGLAFENSTITSVTIESGVSEIQNEAFRGCSSLHTVSLPNSITKIGESAFSGCSILDNVVLPNNLTYINASAFTDCSSLKTISIPNTVTQILRYAFTGCKSLETFTISAAVTNIGDFAFSGCENLKSINVDSDNPNFSSIDGVVFNKDASQLLIYPAGSELVDYVVPNSVTSINSYAFRTCDKINSIKFPKSYSNISSIFTSCSNLTAFIVEDSHPDYSTKDGVLFNKAKTEILIYPAGKKETSYSIPETVTQIGWSAFYTCTNLETLIIPSSVEYIYYYNFSYTTNCKDIYCYCSTPPSVSSNLFSTEFKEGGTLHVPLESIGLYRENVYWGAVNNIQSIQTSYTLVDAEPYSITEDQYNFDITYTRTFPNTEWQALYIPFSMNYSEWEEWADVAEINDVHQFFNNDGEVTETVIEFLTVKSGELKPNTPYVIRAKEAGNVEKTFTDKTLYAAQNGSVDCSSAHWLYTMTGVYQDYNDMLGKYALNGSGEFTRGTSAAQILGPQRFYLEITARDGGYGTSGSVVAPARVRISVDGIETGIEGIMAQPQQSAAYNTQGIRVDNNYKGIVIVNGKKVIKL